MFLMIGIDRISVGRSDLWLPIFGIVGAVGTRFFLVSWARIAVRRAGYLVAFDLRDALYRHLQRMGPRFYERFSVGDLMTRAIADISLIQRLVAFGTISVVIIVFATLVGMSCMTYLSPSLTLLILPPLPFVALHTWRTSRRLGIASRHMQDQLGNLGALVQENLSGIRTIQAMAQEENEIRRFRDRNQEYADAFYEHSRIQSLMSSVMPTLAASSVIIILGYGGSQVLEGQLSVGAFTAYFFYLNMVVQPFRVAGFVVSLVQRAGVAAQRLYDVFDYAPEVQDCPTGLAPEAIRGRIELRNLSFAYRDGMPLVLDDINLDISRGETIAVMGRVGSGKTTLLKLILRMLNTPSKSVYVDGVDVTEYSLRQLRTQVALVPQDVFLFAEALKSNITYDEPNRGIELVWQAAESADIDDTIAELPGKMATVVGERGITLSGGEKQRVTLARGLIRHAPVLLLDDCFSSVDTNTEETILTQLRRLRETQTTILVSHRVSTARHADRIVVLDGGGISEIGRHEELLERRGIYAELERIQREGAHEQDYHTPEVIGR